MKMSNNVLVEVGIEEFPARFIDDAEKQLLTKTKNWLTELNIAFDSIKSYSTPRRLAILIENIAEYQTTIKEEVRGPQVKIAKDDQGNWTKAAIGFTKGQGKELTDIYTKEVKGTSYIFVEKKMEGKKTAHILPDIKQIIASISFPQTMRWGSDSFRFARPLRWIVALLNDQIIPFEIAHVTASNVTYGHRFLGEKSTVTNPLEYETILEKNYVIIDPKKREQLIVEQMKQLEQEENFHIAVNDSLLNEVRNLVEYPTVFHGTFADDFLRLPEETLITSMQEHQRYFPVRDINSNRLLPCFVSVRNGDAKELANVVRGNEKVLRARLADATFFYEEDRKHSIHFFIDKLKTVVFQEKIGTIYEKLNKIKFMTEKLSEDLQLETKNRTEAMRTAEICKFDLMTDMVNEFPELQGIMGEKYALYYGEDQTVAQAIREHYLPVQANGSLPETIAGSVVSIADKLDTIVGCISVGLVPTGSQDPYSLRRQAIGILRILRENKWRISIESLLSIAYHVYEITDENVKKEISQFFKSRAAFILSEEQIEQDIIQAVLHEGIGTFHYTIEKAKLLSAKRNDPSFKQIEEALVRIMNLGKKHVQTNINPALFETESEKELYSMYNEVKEAFFQLTNQLEASNALEQIERLAGPIHQFFEHNMVMADNVDVKQNRLALVHNISTIINHYADVTLIEWKQHK